MRAVNGRISLRGLTRTTIVYLAGQGFLERLFLYGGVDWRKESFPQQTGKPSERMAHVCNSPLLITVKRSSWGGEALP